MALVGAMYQDDIWFTFWWSTMAGVENCVVRIRWKCSGMRCEGQQGSSEASRWSSRTAPRNFTIGDLATHLTGPCVFYYIHWLPCGVPNLLHNNLLIFTAYVFNRKYFTLKLATMDPLKVLNTSSIPLLLLWYLYSYAHSNFSSLHYNYLF